MLFFHNLARTTLRISASSHLPIWTKSSLSPRKTSPPSVHPHLSSSLFSLLASFTPLYAPLPPFCSWRVPRLEAERGALSISEAARWQVWSQISLFTSDSLQAACGLRERETKSTNFPSPGGDGVLLFLHCCMYRHLRSKSSVSST